MFKHVVQTYWRLLKGHRLKAVTLISVTAFSGLMEGVALVCLMPILNSGLTMIAPVPPSLVEMFGFAWNPENKGKMLVVSLGFFFTLGILSALARVVGEIQILKLYSQIELSFRERLEEALLFMKWEKYLTFKMGEITKSISQDGHMIAEGTQAIIQFFGLSLVCLALSILALGLSPKMTLLTLMFGLIALTLSRRISLLSKKYAPDLEASSSSLANATEQYFSNLKFIKSFGLVSLVEKILSTEQQKYAHNFIRTQGLRPLVRFSFESFGIVFITIIVAFAYWGSPAVFGRLIVFLAVFYRIAPRLSSVHDTFNHALSCEPWYSSWKKRYEFAIENREQHAAAPGLTLEEFRDFNFEKVHFQYVERPILKDVSFNLPKGKMLALVGESGGGKTTILDLVTGLVVATSGSCRLNGTPIQNIPLDDWRSKIGLVMQNSPIFHTTVLKNIVMSDLKPDIEKAARSAKLAHAWEFIERLPEKFETMLGQKGANLSQGECQRLALARALYRDPWLLILDEATSALDAQSESFILDTLKSVKGSLTIFMVSHRLGTVDFADEILLLGGGEILERGTYKELMGRLSGDFRRLAKLQGIAD